MEECGFLCVCVCVVCVCVCVLVCVIMSRYLTWGMKEWLTFKNEEETLKLNGVLVGPSHPRKSPPPPPPFMSSPPPQPFQAQDFSPSPSIHESCKIEEGGRNLFIQ